jgi:glycosyltransferase involved in cell wall biosynthesis
MKIGLIAFSTNTGLGNQTFSFYKHMKPHKTLIADLSRMNNMETHHDRFPDAQVVMGIPDCAMMDWLTDDIDILFICETPLNYCVMEKAKAKGVPVVLQYNYEFLDYLNQPQLPPPAVLAAPTIWHKYDVEALNIAPVIDLPVPSEVLDINYREISECRTILHVAGRQAIHDRNGTMTFVRAALKCGNKFKYKIFAQAIDGETDRLILQAQKTIDLEVIYDIEDYLEIPHHGDVMVLPRKYGGLCLPMQEALAAGVPVIMPDIEPNGYRLPKQWLVKAEKKSSFMTRTEIDIYETDVDHLAFKMCQFADEDFMRWSNEEAKQIGKGLRWENLTPLYQSMFQQIINN